MDVSDLKAELMEALDALKEGVLTAMRQRVRQSSDKLIEQFQLTEVELNKASSTGEEVLALKKFIQRSQAQQEKMREDILHNKRSIDFLVRHQMPVTQEVRSDSTAMHVCVLCMLFAETASPALDVGPLLVAVIIAGASGCKWQQDFDCELMLDGNHVGDRTVGTLWDSCGSADLMF